jgi:hypothetical protein
MDSFFPARKITENSSIHTFFSDLEQSLKDMQQYLRPETLPQSTFTYTMKQAILLAKL